MKIVLDRKKFIMTFWDKLKIIIGIMCLPLIFVQLAAASKMITENKKDLWKKNISKIKSKYELYKKKYENMEAFEKEEKDNDPENIDDNNLTIEGAMKRGNQILDKDDKILGELVDIITTDNKTLMVIKNDLTEQQKKLELIDPELKEMRKEKIKMSLKKILKI